jgi:hypothetical protein
VPGRTRLRLKRELRTPEATAAVQQQLNRHGDIHEVSINPRTGSVLVTHARHRRGIEICGEALHEGELLAAVALDLPEGEGGDRLGKLDQQLADLVYRIDYAVWRKTRLHFRGHILAGSLAGLGVAQIALFGISLEMLPGPLLLWIAWDIYHRVAQEPPFPDQAGDAASQPASPEPGGGALAPAT